MAVRPQEYFQTQTFSAIPTPATADANKALAVNDAGTALVYTPLSGRKNLIINGNFDIWQRGTSQTSGDYGSADRWYNVNSGTTKTASQQTFTLGQTDVPGNPKYWMRHVVSSVAGAGNYCFMQQRIESVLTGAGQTVTLSFWAKADASKNIAVEFQQNFGTGGTPSDAVSMIGSQKIVLTTAWTKYTVTAAIPSITGKTLGTDGNAALRVTFWFDAGSTFDTRTASLGQQSGTFDIAQVQLEIGNRATDFERRSIGEELALCQRYYSGLILALHAAVGISPTAVYHFHEFNIPMRAAPVVTRASDFFSGGTAGTVVETQTYPRGFVFSKNGGADPGNAGGHFTADAEL